MDVIRHDYVSPCNPVTLVTPKFKQQFVYFRFVENCPPVLCANGQKYDGCPIPHQVDISMGGIRSVAVGHITEGIFAYAAKARTTLPLGETLLGNTDPRRRMPLRSWHR